MRVLLKTSLLLTVFLITSCFQEAVSGVLYARVPGTSSPLFNLRISHIRTNVRIVGQLAVTHVDEEFFNENNQTLEGFYAFQLPDGAKVDGLWLWVDGQRLSFIVKKKEDAQRMYDSVVVGLQRDPAILESLGKNRFQLKVFPIPPRSSRRIEIRYFHGLPMTEDGWIHYRYSLNLTGYQQTPVEQTTLRIAVESKLDITQLHTNFDDNPLICRTTQLDTRMFSIDFGLEHQMYTRDFELAWKAKDIFSVFPTLAYNDADEAHEDAYFICWHPVKTHRNDTAPRDLVFILDASGSMNDQRLTMVRDAVVELLLKLRETDRFRLVLFSQYTDSWPIDGDGLAYATMENLMAGIDFIDRRYRSGGMTNYQNAFIAGFNASFRREAVRRMLFLTDGEPTSGDRTYNALLELITSRDTTGVALYPVIVFSEKIDLLYDLAIARGGKMLVIESGDDLQTVISRVMLDLYTESIYAPIVTHSDEHTYFVYPKEFPIMVSLDKLVTCGRLSKEGTMDVRLDYLDSDNLSRSITRRIDATQWWTDVRQVAAWWAAARIDELLDQIRKTGMHPELVESVINLSIKHQILTPYTAFLVLENNAIDPPPLSVENIELKTPTDVSVHSVYPNPFRPTAGSMELRIDVHERTPLRVIVIDILGREIAVLHDGELQAGRYTLGWDGKTRHGVSVQPGVFFILVMTSGEVTSRKLLVVH